MTATTVTTTVFEPQDKRIFTTITGSTMPSATASTTLVMAGLGITYTPQVTVTKAIKVTMIATVSNNTATDSAQMQISAGTGAAPAANAALTGTQYGAVQTETSATNNAKNTATLCWVIPVTPGLTYWLDLAYSAVTGGSATLAVVDVIIEEI